MLAQIATRAGLVGQRAERGQTGPAPSREPIRPWLWTAAVAVFAALIRLIHLSHPGTVVFDEHYYVPEASELLAYGVEWNAETDAADFVAHPPLGKWCIALGVALFGDNPFGWRIAAVAFGTFSVVLITRVAMRLFESTWLGVMAGLLMALDGMHFVLSRTGILDIFLMTFVLAGFACLVRDRGSMPWRLATGLCLGLAMGVKWSAVWYLLGFGLLALVWDIRARRRWILRAGALIPAAALGYLVTWSGWFLTDHGWRRGWLADPPVIGPLLSLARYHADMLVMHAGLNADHQYQSQPWEWLLLARPVLFYWTSDVPCPADKCDSEILLLGTPLLWWSFLPALAVLFWLAVRRRDWRWWAVIGGVCAAVAPWMLLPARTKFYFYALPSEPFFILAVVAVFALILGGTHASDERRTNGVILSGAYLAAVALCFVYFYPLYTAMTLTHEQWWARLWWLGDAWI